jgi:hypothetical protein
MVEGVRFSGVFDYGVKGRLTKLNAGCLGWGWFSLRCMANSYKGWCLVCFRVMGKFGFGQKAMIFLGSA